MEMTPRIELLPEKKLVGQRMTMSLSGNRTAALWQRFMPRRKEIGNSQGADLYAVQVYNRHYFSDFDPDAEFEKWATVEVADHSAVPGGMEAFTLPGGLYAVFLHRGAAVTGDRTFRYIFGTWLPGSAYVLDDRPHFEVLGARYRNEDPDSEEEIWIPVRLKVSAGE